MMQCRRWVLSKGGIANAGTLARFYLAAMNQVYGSYFSEPYPARATVQVARLPRDVRIEIDAIASYI